MRRPCTLFFWVLMTLCGQYHLPAAVPSISDLYAEGAYVQIIAQQDHSSFTPEESLLWWRAQMALGHYQDVSTRLKAKSQKVQRLTWQERAIVYRCYDFLGQRAAMKKMQHDALRAMGSDAAQTAADLSAIAEIIVDQSIVDAWDCVQRAHAQDRHYQPAYLIGAKISLRAYSFQNAVDELKILLDGKQKHNIYKAEALTLLARVYFAQGDYQKAEKALTSAREINRYLQDAMNMHITMAMQRHDDEELARTLEQAQRVNTDDQETLALQAAWHDVSGRHALRDDSIARILESNQHNVRVFAVLAQAAERRYRYADALAWGRKALQADPEAWQGMYITAVNLLRLGEEDEGYRLLEQSFKKNPFNMWAFNLLAVLDGDMKDKRYIIRETTYFAMKIPRNLDPLIATYLQQWLDPLYEKLSTQFSYMPQGPKQYKGKILLLFFNKHDEFSARTTGMPNLPAHGATFGSVVTMPMNENDDPRSMHPWYSTLVHEIAHVFTIQKTQWNIPRWLTEGISEWQEGESHVEMDRKLSELVAAGDIPSIAQLSDGIHRPRYRGQVGMTYYLSSLVVTDMEQRYGMQKINSILEKLAGGKKMTEVFMEVTGVSVREYDKLFMGFLEKHCQQLHYSYRSTSEDIFKTLEAAHTLGSIDALDRIKLIYDYMDQNKVVQAQELALQAEKDSQTQRQALIAQGIIALRFARNGIEALDFLNRVLALDDSGFVENYWAGRAALKVKDPTSAEEYLHAAQQAFPRFSRTKKSPYNLLASMYRGQDDSDGLRKILTAHVQADAYYYPSTRELAFLLLQEKKWQAAIPVLERCIQFDIYDARVHFELARCYEQVQKPQLAVQSYRSAVHIDADHLQATAALKRLVVEGAEHN